MKKLFSMVVIGMLFVGLTACIEDFDSIRIEVVTLEGEKTSWDVEFMTDQTLLELVESAFEVGYMDTEYGTYIYSVGDISSQSGNYVAFYKNDELSMVGIDDATYVDGDVFTFQLEWYDATLEATYNAIQLFLDLQVSDYVSEEYIDYNVIAALSMLGIVEDYITSDQVEDYYSDIENTTVTDYFKQIISYQAVGLDATALIEELALIYNVGPYGQTGYGLLGIHAQFGALDSSTYNDMADQYFTLNTPFDEGLDAGSVSVLALTLITTKTDERITDFVEWVKTDQLETGGIKTRDMVYGETTYPGTENAASMSQVIMALISVDQDPSGHDFTKNDTNMVLRLLDFQTEDASFEWTIGGGEDLSFSTPQAFAALVVYQTYKNEFQPINLYDFN